MSRSTPPTLHIHKPGAKRPKPNVCIFGRGGTGKTSLIPTFPGRGLVLETPQPEGGGDFVLKKYEDRIDVEDINDWNELDNIHLYLKNERHDYKWIAVDTLTGLKVLATHRVVADRDLAANPHKITLPEFGTIGQMLGEAVFRFSALPYPIVWIAQEKRYELEGDDPENKDVYIGPEVTKAALASLMPVLTLCGRLTAVPSSSGGWERQLRIGPSERFLTKTRTVSPDIIIPQSIRIANPPGSELADLINYMYGKDITLDVVNEDVNSLLLPGLDLS